MNLKEEITEVISVGVGADDPSAIIAEAVLMLLPQWQPIDTAPVEPSTPEMASYYRFRCLLQNERGEVFEGWGYYASVRRKGGIVKELRWADKHGLCSPKYWMPLPAPRIES